MKPSGIGVTSYVFALTSSELGSRRALEFPALKTLAVIAFMYLQCIYRRGRQVEALPAERKRCCPVGYGFGRL